MHLGADRRQDVATAGRIGEADRGVPCAQRRSMTFGLERQLVGERAVGVDPAIGQQQRRGQWVGL